jgi:alpha-mannosidase
LANADLTVGIANNGQNGFDVNMEGTLNLSLTRGGTHCAWSETDVPTEKSYTFMDQRQIDTRFRLLADRTADDSVPPQLIPAALTLNQPFEAFFTYFPPSLPAAASPKPKPLLQIIPETVVLGALKKAELDEALIVRLVETIGQPVMARVKLEGTKEQEVELGAFEIKTFLIARDGHWTPVDLVEERL